MTGQGTVDQPVAPGAPGPSDPRARPLANVEAAIGDAVATILYAGLAPGMVGVLQMNLVVPEIPDGDEALTVSIGGVAANPAMPPAAHR